MELFVLGLSHKTAPIDVRERLAVPERELPKALEPREVSELASACTSRPATAPRCTEWRGAALQGVEATRASLERYRNLDSSLLVALSIPTRADAARHVFGGLQLGFHGHREPQILGQVKTAYTVAHSNRRPASS